ncbi:hypothetical protein [Micromonospora avicenniae]|uniref:hypothetical protein n=1 Tax=Micromonospora avicenniae TaxID=1198245 RepID=UPI00341BAEB9
MGELASIRKYLYWSERRVSALAQDNNIDLDRARKTVLKSPQGPFLPQIEREMRPRPSSRHDRAIRLEHAIGSLAVSDFVTPPPAQFARGRGTLVLSDFVDQVEGSASMITAFTTTTSSDGTRVAVCMFGSFSNLADVVADSTPRAMGWSSSSAPEVSRFILCRCEATDGSESPLDLAIEAINVCGFQGQHGPESDAVILAEPWRRGFTYGHVSEVGEWFMEVFYDSDLRCTPHRFQEHFDRVIVGAPLWIRTPTLRSLELYDEGREPVIFRQQDDKKNRRFRLFSK